MVKIRLSRVGRKNKPAFRVIAIDSRSKRDGFYLEKIGYYNPSESKEKFEYNKERYDYWLSVGAQPTSAVKKLVNGKYEHVNYNDYKRRIDSEVEQSELKMTSSNNEDVSENSEQRNDSKNETE